MQPQPCCPIAPPRLFVVCCGGMQRRHLLNAHTGLQLWPWTNSVQQQLRPARSRLFRQSRSVRRVARPGCRRTRHKRPHRQLHCKSLSSYRQGPSLKSSRYTIIIKTSVRATRALHTAGDTQHESVTQARISVAAVPHLRWSVRPSWWRCVSG